MNKKLLRFIGATLVIFTFIGGVVFATGENKIKIIVNEEQIESDNKSVVVDEKIIPLIKEIGERLDADVNWDEQANSIIITAKKEIQKVVASIPESGITLSAVENDNGMYEDFTLEINESKRYFDWENVINPTYAPELLLSDINDDGEKELIIILTTGYGTGVHYTNAHVINPETFTETYIDDPRAIILKNVKTKISENKVEIDIGDEKTVIDIDREKMDSETDSEHFFSDVSFKHYRTFQVIDDKLRVSLGARISPTDFIGDVKITYTLKDNMYQASEIKFEKIDNQWFFE